MGRSMFLSCVSIMIDLDDVLLPRGKTDGIPTLPRGPSLYQAPLSLPNIHVNECSRILQILPYFIYMQL